MLKQQNFFDRNIPAWKQVLFLSWPTIVELLLQTAVNYVDTAMVGSIGVNATAAVSITMSTIWLINGFMNAVGIGYSVLAAHSIGEGNYEQAKVIIRQSILAIGVAGIWYFFDVDCHPFHCAESSCLDACGKGSCAAC